MDSFVLNEPILEFLSLLITKNDRLQRWTRMSHVEVWVLDDQFTACGVRTALISVVMCGKMQRPEAVIMRGVRYSAFLSDFS